MNVSLRMYYQWTFPCRQAPSTNNWCLPLSNNSPCSSLASSSAAGLSSSCTASAGKEECSTSWCMRVTLWKIFTHCITGTITLPCWWAFISSFPHSYCCRIAFTFWFESIFFSPSGLLERHCVPDRNRQPFVQKQKKALQRDNEWSARNELSPSGISSR